MTACCVSALCIAASCLLRVLLTADFGAGTFGLLLGTGDPVMVPNGIASLFPFVPEASGSL